MVDILYDMSLISVSKGINKRILENNGMKPTKYILEKYKIDSLQFVESNRYYSSDLEKYLNIYEIVLNKLEENRKEIIDSIDRDKKKRVSIDQENSKNNKILKPKLSIDSNNDILEN